MLKAESVLGDEATQAYSTFITLTNHFGTIPRTSTRVYAKLISMQVRTTYTSSSSSTPLCTTFPECQTKGPWNTKLVGCLANPKQTIHNGFHGTSYSFFDCRLPHFFSQLTAFFSFSLSSISLYHCWTLRYPQGSAVFCRPTSVPIRILLAVSALVHAYANTVEYRLQWLYMFVVDSMYWSKIGILHYNMPYKDFRLLHGLTSTGIGTIARGGGK